MNRHERRVANREPRYRVVLETEDGSAIPYIGSGPKQFCERICEGINRALIKGMRSPLNITGASLQRVYEN